MTGTASSPLTADRVHAAGRHQPRLWRSRSRLLEPHALARALGRLPERRGEIVSSADIVISAERSGFVHLQAMRAGVPVAATSLPVAEAVVDGVTGPHTVGASPAELLLLVRDLLAHPSTAAAGQDRICGRYSWPRIAGETVRVYERALAARTASDPGRPTRQVG